MAIVGTGIAVSLSGCWTAPSASIRPSGEPRVIADRIEVEGVADSAQVESLDRAARTVVLRVNGVLLSYAVGRRVRHWGDVHSGEEVRATLEEELTVYVAPRQERRNPPDAYVLFVDPSYRLLKLQYANGATQTFKVGLHMRVQGIGAGDAVTIHPVAVLKLRRRRHAMLVL